MATSTTKTNKPINPRGNDQSPKGYNRAALYSGKALDFDGVNDDIQISSFSTTGSTRSLSYYFKSSVSDNERVFEIRSGSNYFNSTILNGKINTFDGVNGINTIKTFNDNKWHHVVITHNGNNNAAIYVDGVSQELDASTFSVHDITNTTLYVCSASGAQFYTGGISNVRLFNVALTAAQVSDLYNNPEKIVPTGVAESALKLWLPMMEGAGTYCINGADPLGDDEFEGAGSFDSATGWTLNAGCSIGGGKLSINGTQTANTSAYKNITSVASSLVMAQFTLSNVTAGQVQLAFFGASGTATKWYTEDGTYTEYVEVAAGHNGNTGFIAKADFVGDIDDLTLKVVNTGAISGATWTHGVGSPVAQTAVIDWNKETTGAGTTMLLPQGLTSGRDITGVNLFENVRKQGALNLDGNSWAEVHDNASVDLTTSLSLEVWCYPTEDGTSSGRELIGKFISASSPFQCWALEHNNNFFDFGIGATDNSWSILASSTGKTKENWYHVVATYDGATRKIYVNGVEEGSAAFTKTPQTTDKNIAIGRWLGQAVGGANTFFGPIAQPRIYNRALTAEEVQRNYDAGKNIYTNS